MSELGFLILAELESETVHKEKFDIAIDEGGSGYSLKSRKPESGDKRTTWYYLSLVGEIGFSIAIPITAGVLIGSYVDRSSGSYPKWTIGLLLVGTFLAVLHMVRVVRTVLKD